MLVAAFSSQPYDRTFLEGASAGTALEWRWFTDPLGPATARLAESATAVNCFVNDDLGAETIAVLSDLGVRLITLRCTGFNNVDLHAAGRAGIPVVRVPEYSPHSVAEHTLGLILTLTRNLHRAVPRVRDGNFSLQGLLGTDLHGRTAGVVGTGKIGACVAKILLGLGLRVLAHDPRVDDSLAGLGVRYVDLPTLVSSADIVTLHCPLLPSTRHMIDADAIARMKHGTMLVNTSRGALVDTRAVIDALKSGRIGHLGIDVYEEEQALFFADMSDEIIADDVFTRLLTFPNVVVTAHQAFFTRNAMDDIARQTVRNLLAFHRGEPLTAVVGPPA